MTSLNAIQNQPVFAALPKKAAPAPTGTPKAVPFKGGKTETQPDALQLRDALIARQPKFGAVVRPQIIEIAPDGRVIAQDPTSKNFNEEKVITFNAPIYDITSFVFNRQMKYLVQKILDERLEAGIEPDDIRKMPEAQDESGDIDPKKFVPERDKITIYLTSYGGDIFSLYSMHDMIDRAKNNGVAVSVIGTGLVGEEAVYLMAAGTPGHRGITANTLVELSQPRGRGGKDVIDAEIYFNLARETKERLINFLVDYGTKGRTAEEVEKAMKRPNYMEADEVVNKWGWADFIADT